MEAMDTTARDTSQGKLSLMLAIGAVVTMAVLAAIDHDGPVWILQGVLGLAAAVVGYRAGGTSPKSGPAFVGFLVGTILFLIFMGFVIAGD